VHILSVARGVKLCCRIGLNVDSQATLLKERFGKPGIPR
jgi:hypothetical protein